MLVGLSSHYGLKLVWNSSVNGRQFI